MASVTAPGSPLPVQHPAPATMRIESPRGWLDLYLGEVWSYQELLSFFLRRDVKLRYQQTVIGVAWAALQPLLTRGLLTLFFGRLSKLPRTVSATPCLISPRSPNQASLQNHLRILKGGSILARPEKLPSAGDPFGHMRLYTPQKWSVRCPNGFLPRVQQRRVQQFGVQGSAQALAEANLSPLRTRRRNTASTSRHERHLVHGLSYERERFAGRSVC
jgi:hypothetical protein